MSDPAVMLFEAQRRQRTGQAMDKAITMLLDLFRTAHGPLPDSGEYSQADRLKIYADMDPTALALLHALGLGKLLELPTPSVEAMQRVVAVRAGRKAKRSHR